MKKKINYKKRAIAVPRKVIASAWKNQKKFLEGQIYLHSLRQEKIHVRQ